MRDDSPSEHEPQRLVLEQAGEDPIRGFDRFAGQDFLGSLSPARASARLIPFAACQSASASSSSGVIAETSGISLLLTRG